MLGHEKIYVNSAHPEDKKTLEALTAPSNWDSDQFDRVMVALGLVGNGESVPAINRPESVHLQKYRKFFEELLKRTKDAAREHARVIFVDRGENRVVMSNKISVGTVNEVKMHVIPQPGREKFQTLIGSVHTHPIDDQSLSHGLSGTDYKTFLSDPRQQFMIITFGENVRMMVLKTSATPNNISVERTQQRIAALEKEFFRMGGSSQVQIVDFNKTACLEFGLTLYMANKTSNDMFTRVNVVH